jgi:hypothetical protein
MGAEDLVGHVEERHVLVRPDRLDLAGQLDADRPGPDEQHPRRRAERRVGRADFVVGDCRAVDVTLRRERVVRSGRQDDVVRVDLLAGGEHHPAGVDLGGAVADHPAVAEQAVVGQVDAGQPGRVSQGAERGDVVHEGILRLHEDDIGHVVQGLGHIDAAVAASYDHDGRF